MSQEAQQASYDSLLDSKTIQQIIAKAEEKGLPGIPSGFIGLDRITNCWKRSTLTVLAGPPSMGCTSLMLAFLRNAVVEFKTTTALFSLQLSREQLLTKWLSAETEVPYEKIESGNLHDHEWLKINTSTALWTSHAEAFIRVLDDANPTIEKVMEDCRRLREEGVSLFLIDNLSRITLGKKSRAFCPNREQEVSHIIRCLKSLARELEAPVIVVSHMNRSGRERAYSYRPQLGDLRDSGTVEYEADVIILLHRPEYYKQTEDDMGNPTYNVAELIVAKNAFGRTETVQVEFKSACGRFSDQEQPRFSGSDFDEEEGFAPNTIRLGSRLNATSSGKKAPQPFPRSSFDDGPPPF